jgi:chemotaxis-related protein WspB
MLLVLFQVGSERCAMDAQRVVEVIPLVALKKLPHLPPGVAGVFLYRGRPVPALDLCQLSLGRPAAEHFSTRILIVNHSNAAGTEQFLGLIAERVTETMRREPRELTAPDPAGNPAAPGTFLMDARGVIQLLVPEKLVQQSLRTQLFAQPLEAARAND